MPGNLVGRNGCGGSLPEGLLGGPQGLIPLRGVELVPGDPLELLRLGEGGRVSDAPPVSLVFIVENATLASLGGGMNLGDSLSQVLGDLGFQTWPSGAP